MESFNGSIDVLLEHQCQWMNMKPFNGAFHAAFNGAFNGTFNGAFNGAFGGAFNGYLSCFSIIR